MMLRQLSESGTERIRSAWGEHPLYAACQSAFTPLLAKMDAPCVDVEEVFCEATHLLDDLLTETELTQHEIDHRWSEILIGFRRRHKDISQSDTVVSAHTVFSVVSTALSLHWYSYYCDTLRELLQSTLEREASTVDVSDVRTMNIRLASHASELSEWMNDYADDVEPLISDEVDACISGKPSAGKKPGSGRKKHSPSTIRMTFTYQPQGMREEEVNIRLGVAFRELKSGGYVHEDTDQQTFLSLFQGVNLDTKMVWAMGINALCYLFRQLAEKHKYIEKPKGPGLWQVVAAHFLNSEEQTLDSEKLRTTTGKPKDTQQLDNIISLFNPQLLDFATLQDMLRRADSNEGHGVQEHYKSAGMNVKRKR